MKMYVSLKFGLREYQKGISLSGGSSLSQIYSFTFLNWDHIDKGTQNFFKHHKKLKEKKICLFWCCLTSKIRWAKNTITKGWKFIITYSKIVCCHKYIGLLWKIESKDSLVVVNASRRILLSNCKNLWYKIGILFSIFIFAFVVSLFRLRIFFLVLTGLIVYVIFSSLMFSWIFLFPQARLINVTTIQK